MSIKIKMRIKKLQKAFIRDRWGNLTPCQWNDFIKEDIIKLENVKNN
jgi:hypothetical protein